VQNAASIPASEVEARADAAQALSGISKEIAKAHCSIVELYLSDLWYAHISLLCWHWCVVSLNFGLLG
jgi:hypothetical protein